MEAVVDRLTPSGRVGTLTVTTDRGNFVLRGNDIRFVPASPVARFSRAPIFRRNGAGADGSLARLTLHGWAMGMVSAAMCQWGAIGRARAGQDFRAILQAYYQGTGIGPAP